MATMKEISASEFEEYRAKIKVVALHVLSAGVRVNVQFTGADGQLAWRVDDLDCTRYYVPRNVDIWS